MNKILKLFFTIQLSLCLCMLQSRGAADIWWDILHHVDGAAEESRKRGKQFQITQCCFMVTQWFESVSQQWVI